MGVYNSRIKLDLIPTYEALFDDYFTRAKPYEIPEGRLSRLCQHVLHIAAYDDAAAADDDDGDGDDNDKR